jgi:predicted peptidase
MIMQIKVSNLVFLTLSLIFVFLFVTRKTILKSSINKLRNRFINGRTVTGEYQKDNVRLKYRYFEPVTNSVCPLLVILHGAGERGSDNIKQVDYNTIKFIKEIRNKYSPLILLPQCPSDNVWTINPGNPFNNFYLDSIPVSTTLEIVKDIILKLVKEYPVDTDRIYIIGYSMGGTGTWEMIFRNPDLFAAAIPICAAADPSKASLVKDIHIWVFSAENDQFYNYRETEETVKMLKENSCDVKYTLYKNQEHYIWGLVFNDPEVTDWLFSQRRGDNNWN